MASDQAGPEGNTKKKYTAKSAGRKVRRAGELCQSTVSTFVTASDAKSSGCTASHRQEGERAKRKRKRGRESEVCCFNLQFSPLDEEREKRLNRN